MSSQLAWLKPGGAGRRGAEGRGCATPEPGRAAGSSLPQPWGDRIDLPSPAGPWGHRLSHSEVSSHQWEVRASESWNLSGALF